MSNIRKNRKIMSEGRCRDVIFSCQDKTDAWTCHLTMVRDMAAKYIYN